MIKVYSYVLEDGRVVKDPPNSGEFYTTQVSLIPRRGYTFQNILTGKKLKGLTTFVGTESFWKEVLLDEKEQNI